MLPSGVVAMWTANRKLCLRVGAIALPEEVMTWMDEHAEELESLLHRQRASVAFAQSSRSGATVEESLEDVATQFRERMQEAGVPEALATATLCGMSVARGSRAVLLDTTGSRWTLQESHSFGGFKGLEEGGPLNAEHGETSHHVPSWLRASVLAGFQLAASAGPLCEEPMRGVAFVVHSCQQIVGAAATGEEATGGPALGGGSAANASQLLHAAAAAAGPYGPMSGQVMVAAKEACRCSLFRRGYARICEAMLSLEVQCEQAMLGKVYGVLGKRRAKVLDEGLRDGTSLFYISSYLPLADSFGIAQDLRQAASGHVSFHCAFSHWEQSEDDPFQEASLTAEEIEELGDQPLMPNVARKLVDAIRKRKGLATDEKLVKDASKQRTITRNK